MSPFFPEMGTPWADSHSLEACGSCESWGRGLDPLCVPPLALVFPDRSTHRDTALKSETQDSGFRKTCWFCLAFCRTYLKPLPTHACH